MDVVRYARRVVWHGHGLYIPHLTHHNLPQQPTMSPVTPSMAPTRIREGGITGLTCASIRIPLNASPSEAGKVLTAV